jgi:hypothetical protein
MVFGTRLRQVKIFPQVEMYLGPRAFDMRISFIDMRAFGFVSSVVRYLTGTLIPTYFEDEVLAAVEDRTSALAVRNIVAKCDLEGGTFGKKMNLMRFQNSDDVQRERNGIVLYLIGLALK